MFELNAPINEARMKAIATGHAQTLERWEDGPNGRRSTGQPLIDEATGAPVRIYDCLFPTGRDGRHELHGVRIVSHEAPELAPLHRSRASTTCAPASARRATAPRASRCPSPPPPSAPPAPRHRLDTSDPQDRRRRATAAA